MSIIETLVEEIERSAAHGVDSAIEYGGDILAREPERLPKAIYGDNLPDKARTLAEMAADCDRFIAGEVGRQAHWSFDGGRLLRLRQARHALDKLLA